MLNSRYGSIVTMRQKCCVYRREIAIVVGFCGQAWGCGGAGGEEYGLVDI